MKTNSLCNFIFFGCQNKLCLGLDKLSKSHPNWGRVCALPISVADVALEVFKMPLNAIEKAVLVPINLVGSAFSLCKFNNSCTLKDSLVCAELALESIAMIPVSIFMAMPKLVFQFSSIMIDPKTTWSVTHLSHFKSSVGEISRKKQDELYSKLNGFSASDPNIGRHYAASVSIRDVALDTFRAPLVAIESAARAAIHLVGAVLSLGYKFENSYTLRDSLVFADAALRNAAATPVAIFMAAPKLAFQISAIVIDPRTVQSINYLKLTYSVA